MSRASAPQRASEGWPTTALMGAIALGCGGLVIASADDRALAAQLTIGLFAADLALLGLRFEQDRRAWLARGCFALLNLSVVGVACALLSKQSPAWLLAVPVALASPERMLGSPGIRLAKLLGLALAVGVGQAVAGVPAVELAVSVCAVTALAVALHQSSGLGSLRQNLFETRRELELQRESSREMQLRISQDSERVMETQRQMTAEFEASLARAAARQAEVLSAVVDTVLNVGRDGRILSCNPAAQRLLHADEESIVGQPLMRFLPQAKPGALALMARASRDAMAQGEAAVVRELTCIPLRGRQIEVEVALGTLDASAIEGRAETDSYTMVVRDISTRKEVERMKDDLVATVSHELRTPLTAILGSLQLMTGGAAGELPPKAVELLALAERNGKRLVDLINDILDIQKMSEGKMAFDMARCSLSEICERAVDSVRPMGQAVSVEFSYRTESELPEVWADAGRIEQVVTNLLSNAVKFSPRDSQVQVFVAAPDRDRVRVEVRDMGPGLEPHVAERVFERFVQGESGDTRASGGTGLGLAISRSIVERHGGEIGVESVAGEGANFYFELPTVNLVHRGNSGPVFESSAAVRSSEPV